MRSALMEFARSQKLPISPRTKIGAHLGILCASLGYEILGNPPLWSTSIFEAFLSRPLQFLPTVLQSIRTRSLSLCVETRWRAGSA